MQEHTFFVVVTVPPIDLISFVLGAISASLFWLAITVLDLVSRSTPR